MFIFINSFVLFQFLLLNHILITLRFLPTGGVVVTHCFSVAPLWTCYQLSDRPHVTLPHQLAPLNLPTQFTSLIYPRNLPSKHTHLTYPLNLNILF